MRIISYRFYTISYQICYEFFACFFLMVVFQYRAHVRRIRLRREGEEEEEKEEEKEGKEEKEE